MKILSTTTTTAIALLSLAVLSMIDAIEIGERIPKDLTLHHGFPPETISLDDRMANKKVLLIGLPGAFTPTWSTRQVPGYLAKEEELKKVGVDDVIIYSVNDAAVVLAWAENQGATPLDANNDSLVHLYADPYSSVTEALKLEMHASGPKMVGLLQRCKRHALYVVNGIVQIKRVAEAEDDPAGDDFPDVTLADAMILAIQGYNDSTKAEAEL